MNGFCDIVILGNGFGQKLESQFISYANTVKANLLKREPFASRASVLNFHIVNSKQNLNCKPVANGLDESLQCTFTKVKAALKGIPANIVLVIDWLNGYGGANGQIAAVGINKLIDPFAGDLNYCTKDIKARAFDGLAIHETGHAFGCDHELDPFNGNVMSFATNGGCDLVGKPFVLRHQTVINDFIDKAKLT